MASRVPRSSSSLSSQLLQLARTQSSDSLIRFGTAPVESDIADLLSEVRILRKMPTHLTGAGEVNPLKSKSYISWRLAKGEQILHFAYRRELEPRPSSALM